MILSKSAAVACLLLLTGLGACALFHATDSGQDLDRLACWMTGSFSSQQQSLEDPEFFDIRLKMARIWPERTDGYWLYVEQAAASSLDRPYRQRVYHVTQQDPETFISAVFELEDPLKYVGVWKEADPLAQVSPESLKERQGAAIFLKKRADGTFAGSTEGKKCLSTLRGASYATSKVEISEEQIYSWDQGFDAQDQQVWGAVKSGYIFKKITER